MGYANSYSVRCNSNVHANPSKLRTNMEGAQVFTQSQTKRVTLTVTVTHTQSGTNTNMHVHKQTVKLNTAS